MNWAEVTSYGICLFVFSLLCIGNWPAKVIRAIRGTEPLFNDNDEDDGDSEQPLLTVFFKLLHPSAIVPTRANNTDAGYDLFALEDIRLQPGERMLVKTGLKVAIPEGFYGRIAPRSGLALGKGIDVLAGVLDSGYRGEVGVILLNTGQSVARMGHDKAIAQLIVEAYYEAKWEEVEELPDSERGDGGFGSTDRV